MLSQELQPLDTKVFATVYWLEQLRDGTCTASNATIGRISGGTGASVGNSLNRLREQNFIICQYDANGRRVSMNTLVKMGRPTSNDGGGLHQMMNRVNNTKKEEYSSETKENIDKVYLLWLKYMVVDPDIRVNGAQDERHDALEAAKKRTKLTDKRKSKVAARLADAGLPRLQRAIVAIGSSDFHRTGIDSNGNQGTFVASLEWLCNSYEKVEEWSNKYRRTDR